MEEGETQIFELKDCNVIVQIRKGNMLLDILSE